ncbi:EAL domain-containing protein [Zobellella taiwanensis]
MRLLPCRRPPLRPTPGRLHPAKVVVGGLLLLAMLTFGLGAAHTLVGIRKHNDLLERRTYEVPWSLMQLQLEVNRFLDAVRLLHAGAIGHDELMLRYDILWSRTPVLLSSQLKDTLSERPDLWLLIQQIETRVRAMEPLVKVLVPGSPAYQLLLAELSPYLEPLTRTLTATMHSNVMFYAEYDQAYRQLGRQLYVRIGGLGGSTLLLLLLLWRELRGYRHQLLHDPLTGLPNRFSLQRRLEQLMARRLPFSLILLELEDATRVHHRFGFEVADRLQQAFAGRLGQGLQAGESLARCGGDGLVVVAEGVVELAEVRARLSRIRQALVAVEPIADHDFYMKPVIGVVLYPADADNLVDLLARGELALALCRRDRQPYVIFDPSLLKEIRRRQQLAQDLPTALDRGSLNPGYLPLVDADDHCVGLQLTLQWRHPAFGVIGDSELWRVAEQFQLAERLLLWLLDHAGEALRDWRRSRPGLFLNLTLPASAFRATVLELLLAVLARHGLDAGALVLDLSEETVMADPHETRPLLDAFRERGIRLALADFGSGCSVWGQLARLPLDWLKLDEVFCNGIAMEGEARRQLRLLFELAGLLSLPLICCGVNNAAELEVVRELGGRPLLQGRQLGGVLAAVEVPPWLAAH